ncbi:GntR family transcriptional regulator [Microbacteriaceae bacterium K1510]|nr:GntR family transcriptional regulator [Microbacteriaceae bacterium K1510]
MSKKVTRKKKVGRPKTKVQAVKHAKKKAGRSEKPKGQKGGSLVARAYEELKERIITVYFLPGQYLNEGAICALLGLGRTPVHQALQRLEIDGLVEIMPRKGVIVLPDSIAEIIKILDSRMAVEPELARHAAERATAETAAELKALASVQKSDPDISDIDAFTTSDRAFHRKLADMSGNQVLSDFARNLHERSWRYWYLHLWQTLDINGSNRQHTAIAEAVAKRDGDTAANAMREHISSLKQRLSQIQSARGGTRADRHRSD